EVGPDQQVDVATVGGHEPAERRLRADRWLLAQVLERQVSPGGQHARLGAALRSGAHGALDLVRDVGERDGAVHVREPRYVALERDQAAEELWLEGAAGAAAVDD